jgi:hypothetical protein
MDTVKLQIDDWKNANVQVFWGEVAPCEHVVQIYTNENHFLNTLEGFAGSGLLSGDSVIIIATETHLNVLNQRLLDQGFDIPELISTHRYFPLDATETLAKFTINNWPEEQLFQDFISELPAVAKTNGRKVRAFGEMVAVLWAKGLNGATVQLENLWHKLHALDHFSLYCAYPKSGFTRSYKDSLDQICKAHSTIIDGENRPSTEIYYIPL